MSFKIDDYVDVAERITKFYEKFPDGRLTRLGEPKVQEVGNKLFVIYTAKAYRTADDPVPAIGMDAIVRSIIERDTGRDGRLRWR